MQLTLPLYKPQRYTPTITHPGAQLTAYLTTLPLHEIEYLKQAVKHYHLHVPNKIFSQAEAAKLYNA